MDFPLARGQINSRLSHWTANKPGRPGFCPFFPIFFACNRASRCGSLLPPFLIQYPKKRAFNYESEESYLVLGNEIDDGMGTIFVVQRFPVNFVRRFSFFFFVFFFFKLERVGKFLRIANDSIVQLERMIFDALYRSNCSIKQETLLCISLRMQEMKE